MSKKTPEPTAEKKDHNELRLQSVKGKTEAERFADYTIQPEFRAMWTILTNNKRLDNGYKIDITETFEILKRNGQAVVSGDLSLAERGLATQAQTLDCMFHSLVNKALSHTNLEPFKTMMNLALKAQNQSRMTWETLGLLKNPQPYVRQQNVAQQQIVNNGNLAHADKNQKATNELLEDTRHEQEWMDARTPQTAVRADKELEAVATVNRSKDSKRQSQGKAKCT